MPEEPDRPPAALASVTAIVATRNRRHKLEHCLRALASQDELTQLVVVDDGSEDGTFELASELAATDERIVAERIPHEGKAAALQAGLASARSEVILLVDDDVIAGPGLVRGHAAYHSRRADLVVVGYMPCVRSEPFAGDRFLTDLYAREYEAHCLRLEADPGLVLRCLWGGNVSLRREHCERVNFVPWRLAHEDQDFGLRCLRHGLTGVFDRTLHAEHRHERDLSQFLHAAREQGAARYYLAARYGAFVDSLPEWQPLDGLGAASSLLVRGLGRERVHGLAEQFLLLTAQVAERAHLPVLTANAKRLARRIALQSGYSLAQAAGSLAGPEYRLDELRRLVAAGAAS
ncbi:MAG TPA: glycosyltransferase family A protein [Acidimicrobiales bacterium]|nr:glycosyltransferase family A protein [Acidimicrobiales bacterium]